MFARVQEKVDDRAVRAGRRHVGGVRHQHARRRGAGPAVRARQAVLPRGVRRRDRGGVAAGLLRLHRGAAAADRSWPASKWFLTQKISWNTDQQVPAPHLRVGGHRRHPDLHPLPAGRHLQLRPVRRRTRPRRAQLPGQGRAPPGRWCRSATATAAAAPPARCWPGPRGWRDLEGSAQVAHRAARRLLRRGRGGVPGPAGVGRRAVPGAPPRHPTPAGHDQAGQPAQRAPAARGRAVGGHRRRARRAPTTRTSELDRIWKTVLLHQFHDILPGTSIAWVHREAEQTYAARRRRADGDHRRARSARWPGRPARTAARWSSTPRRTAATACPRCGGAPARRRGPPRSAPVPRRTAATSLDNGLLRVVDRRPRPGHLGVRPRRRPRGARPGRRRQPAPAAPGPPEPVGRLGRRRLLPQHRHRPDRRRRGRPSTGGRASRGAVPRPSAPPGSSRCSRLRRGRRPARHRHRASTGTSGRSCSRPPSRSTCAPTHASAEIPVRPRLPAHPHQHQLGRGQVRGLRAPLPARRRARLGRRAGQRLHLRPRRHPRRARRTAAPPPRSGCRCCARRASPTRTPTRARTTCATRWCPAPAIADAVARGLPLQPAASARCPAPRGGRPAGRGRQRRPWWSRRSSSPTTAPATWSSGSTKRTAARPRATLHPGLHRWRRSSVDRPAGAPASRTTPRSGSPRTARVALTLRPFQILTLRLTPARA